MNAVVLLLGVKRESWELLSLLQKIRMLLFWHVAQEIPGVLGKCMSVWILLEILFDRA